jgi:hypothetical protein
MASMDAPENCLAIGVFALNTAPLAGDVVV